MNGVFISDVAGGGVSFFNFSDITYLTEGFWDDANDCNTAGDELSTSRFVNVVCDCSRHTHA